MLHSGKSDWILGGLLHSFQPHYHHVVSLFASGGKIQELEGTFVLPFWPTRSVFETLTRSQFNAVVNPYRLDIPELLQIPYSLTVANFLGHCPAVYTNQRLLTSLLSVHVLCLNQVFFIRWLSLPKNGKLGPCIHHLEIGGGSHASYPKKFCRAVSSLVPLIIRFTRYNCGRRKEANTAPGDLAHELTDGKGNV